MSRRGKTISLMGKAAKAFVETKIKPTAPASSEEKYERVATLVHVYVTVNDFASAVGLLKLVAVGGVDVAHEAVMRHSAEMDKKPCPPKPRT